MSKRTEFRGLRKAIKICATQLRASDKINISEAIVKEYINDVRAVQNRTGDFDPAADMDKLRDEIKERQLRHNDKVAQQKYLGIRAQRYFRKIMADNPDISIKKIMILFLNGLSSDRAGSGLSIAAKIAANQQAFLSKLIKGIETAMGTGSKYEDFLNNEDLVLEVFELYYNDGKVGSDLAKAIKKSIVSVMEDVRRLGNANGADIGVLDDFVAFQEHDVAKLKQTSDTIFGSMKIYTELVKKHGNDLKELFAEEREISFQRWKGIISPLLNHERTFADWDIESEADKDKIFLHAYNNIKRGFKLVEDPTEPGELTISFGGKRISSHRFFHFKNALARREYNSKFGKGTFASSPARTLNSMGRQIGLMEILGPNYDATFKKITEIALAESTKRKGEEELTIGSFDRATAIFKTITGENSTVEKQWLANVGTFMRGWETLSKLGLMMFSSVPDLGIMATNIRSGTGENFPTAFAKIIMPFFNRVDKRAKKFFADTFTSNSRLRIGMLVRRYSGDDSNVGTAARLMQTFSRAVGINWWDSTNKSTMAMLWGRILGREKDTEFNSLNKQMKRSFGKFNIDEAKWDLYRKLNVEEFEARHYMGPRGEMDITHPAFKEYLKKTEQTDLSNFEKDQLGKNLDDTLSAMFTSQIETGVVTPGPAEISDATWGKKPGTVGGELVRAITQYKLFAYTYARKVLGPAILRATTGDDKLSGSLDLISLLTTTLGLGYTSLVMKNTLKGKDTPNTIDTIGKAFIQGGGIGFYADWLFGNYARYGETLTSQLIGPSFGTINQFLRMVYTLGSASSGGATREFLRGNVPFMNLWFTNAAWNYLFFFSLSNYLDPGYIQRHVANARRKDQAQYFISPTDAVDPFGSL